MKPVGYIVRKRKISRGKNNNLTIQEVFRLCNFAKDFYWIIERSEVYGSRDNSS